MKWTMFALLISLCCVLVFTGLAAVIPSVHQTLTNSGAHGFQKSYMRIFQELIIMEVHLLGYQQTQTISI